jgi:hypothetical protein
MPAEGSVEVSAVRPDGGVEPLLWLNRNTPEWQFPFVLREPAHLPAGSRLVVTAYAGRGAGDGPVSVQVAVTEYAPPAAPAPTASAASASAVAERR